MIFNDTTIQQVQKGIYISKFFFSVFKILTNAIVKIVQEKIFYFKFMLTKYHLGPIYFFSASLPFLVI